MYVIKHILIIYSACVYVFENNGRNGNKKKTNANNGFCTHSLRKHVDFDGEGGIDLFASEAHSLSQSASAYTIPPCNFQCTSLQLCAGNVSTISTRINSTSVHHIPPVFHSKCIQAFNNHQDQSNPPRGDTVTPDNTVLSLPPKKVVLNAIKHSEIDILWLIPPVKQCTPPDKGILPWKGTPPENICVCAVRNVFYFLKKVPVTHHKMVFYFCFIFW